MQSKSKQSGDIAEMMALNYLEQQGLKLINKNFTSRFGEIDLIMQDNDTLTFIEVKKRTSGIDNAVESITYAKQKKLILTAQYFLLKIKKTVNCRFDVVAIDGNNAVKWLKNVIIM